MVFSRMPFLRRAATLVMASVFPALVFLDLVFLGLVGSTARVSAEPVTAARLRPAPDDPTAFLIDGQYLRDERVLADMRARGDLPDTITDGACRFELAGDPGVAYYVRTCP